MSSPGSQNSSLASSSSVATRAGAVAGSVPRRADATGFTITSSTPNRSASANLLGGLGRAAQHRAPQPAVHDAPLLGGELGVFGILDQRHRPERLPGAKLRHHLQVGQHQSRCLVPGFGHYGVDRQKVSGSGVSALGRNRDR